MRPNAGIRALTHSRKSWLHEHRSKVRVGQIRAERRLFHPIRRPVRPNYPADTTLFTETLPTQPPEI